MITIFDLDYTLLNTASFKKALAGILRMSAEEFDLSYEENFKSKKENYNIEAHLDKMGVENKKKILENFKNLMADISDYLNEGAREAVLNERMSGNKVVLLTFGNESWQQEKVNRLGDITDLFDEIVYESEKKENSPYFKSIPKEAKLKIINDNFKETKRIVEKISKYRDGEKSGIEVTIIKGPYSEDTDELRAEIEEIGWRYCENIGDLNRENQEVAQERKFAIR